MTSPVHFISGLPRSGSTLLCAILKQNPRFAASMTSPVASLFMGLIPKMAAKTEFSVFFDDPKRRTILRAVFDAYHERTMPGTVTFDTNRTWTGKAALLADLFPDMRIICCVREVGWVLDSVERMIRRNPLQVARFVNPKSANTIYARVAALMDSETGLVGAAWSNLREAWFSEFAERLVVIDYESLTRDPRGSIASLYKALGEKQFAHDFDDVAFDADEFDAEFGMAGLHQVRRKVEPFKREAVIPPDIISQYAQSNFWRGQRRTTSKAAVLI